MLKNYIKGIYVKRNQGNFEDNLWSVNLFKAALSDRTSH